MSPFFPGVLRSIYWAVNVADHQEPRYKWGWYKNFDICFAAKNWKHSFRNF